MIAKTWTLDELIAALQVEGSVHQEQIAGLLCPVNSREHQIVLWYVLLQSCMTAATLANAKGYRVSDAAGPMPYCTKDVIALVRLGHPTVPAGLLDLARRGLPTSWYTVRKG